MDAARQNQDRVGHPKIAPGMSTRATHNDFETAAAQSLSHDRIGTGTVQDQAVADRVFPAGLGKNVTHSAQVAFSLFAHVADKKYGCGQRYFGCAQRGCHRQQGRGSGSVIRNAGPVEAVALLTQVERSSSGKNRIDVSAERDVLLGRGWFGQFGMILMNAEHVAHFVGADIFEFERAKAFAEPFSARRLSKWRSRNARHFQLPGRKLGFLGAKPGESRADFWRPSETGDLLLHRGGDKWHFRAWTRGHNSTTPSYNVTL